MQEEAAPFVESGLGRGLGTDAGATRPLVRDMLRGSLDDAAVDVGGEAT
jgi:hypothetical protein